MASKQITHTVDADGKLVIALKTLLMCSPRAIAPTTAMTIALDETQDQALRVTSRGFTLGKAFASNDRGAHRRQAHAIARGMLHVMLGHPTEMTFASDRTAFDLACQIQVDLMIDGGAILPSGMFERDPAILEAMTGMTIGRDATLDEILAEVLAHPLPAFQPVVVRADYGDTGHDDILGLVALAADGRGDLVDLVARIVGADMPEPASGKASREAAMLLALPQVADIAEGRRLASKLEGLKVSSMSRDVATASIVEAMLRTLKRNGAREKDINVAFGDLCQAQVRDILASGPLIRIG